MFVKIQIFTNMKNKPSYIEGCPARGHPSFLLRKSIALNIPNNNHFMIIIL